MDLTLESKLTSSPETPLRNEAGACRICFERTKDDILYVARKRTTLRQYSWYSVSSEGFGLGTQLTHSCGLAELHEPLPGLRMAKAEGFNVLPTPWLPGPAPFLSLPHPVWCSPVTFIVVILHGEDSAFGRTGTVKNKLPVQGLDGEGVQHTDIDLVCEGRPGHS